MKWSRKPGEPIYQRRHMVALLVAVCLPIVLVQLYKVYIGPIGFFAQLTVAIVVSVFAGIGLYLLYNSSARNEP
ncbi:conserved protein of unknown function [Nitrospira japonica]|uniref:Uncharacterized protein n=1 Tax=Nitrospira japonica TaxID=1325564 RepID=A0A1W1IAH8_9BACT|nr:hypothetical protein [Nitrospira japonica]SLM50024.1 conserved protein of unknown function [Nitrospira japonica]